MNVTLKDLIRRHEGLNILVQQNKLYHVNELFSSFF